MQRTFTALLVALSLILGVGVAAAQSKSSVQVLAIASEDAYEQAQALTIALKRAVTRTEGWALAKGDFSLEVLTAALSCPLPPDAGCQKKISDKVGSKRYVWGTLAMKGKKEVVATLRLWENGEQKRDTTLSYASNLTDPSDDTLMNIAYDGFAKLTGAAQGVLVVSAGNVTGQVFVDGAEAGTVTDGRTELTLASGEHKVIVRATGYNDAVGTVTVRPGASTEITLNPTPIGSGTPTGDATKDDGKGGNTKRLLAYGAVGLGGVLALAGGYFWFKSYSETQKDEYKNFQKTVKPSEGEVCEAAKGRGEQNIIDICNSNSRNQTLAWVLVPTGVVLAGVGVYLLVTDESKPAAARKRPRVQPFAAAGPDGGHVWVNVAF